MRIFSECIAIVILLAARVMGVMPLPAWPFLLGIAAIFGAAPWRDFTESLAKTRRQMIVIGVAVSVGVGYQFFTIFVEGPFLAWLFGEPETPPDVDFLVGNTAALVGFSALVTAFAVGEELAYRGYLLERLRGWLRKVPLGAVLALLLSSAAFGAMHTWQNLPGVTGTAISGLVFGCVYLASGSDSRAAIATHVAVNLTAVFLAYFGLFIDS